jgi:hypothetical protein
MPENTTLTLTTIPWGTTEEAARRLGVCRDTLDGMLDRAPRDLPGAPVDVGTGKCRRHLRWDLDRVNEWATAYRDWMAARRGRKARATVPVR